MALLKYKEDKVLAASLKKSRLTFVFNPIQDTYRARQDPVIVVKLWLITFELMRKLPKIDDRKWVCIDLNTNPFTIVNFWRFGTVQNYQAWFKRLYICYFDLKCCCTNWAAWGRKNRFRAASFVMNSRAATSTRLEDLEANFAMRCFCWFVKELSSSGFIQKLKASAKYSSMRRYSGSFSYLLCSLFCKIHRKAGPFHRPLW